MSMIRLFAHRLYQEFKPNVAEVFVRQILPSAQVHMFSRQLNIFPGQLYHHQQSNSEEYRERIRKEKLLMEANQIVRKVVKYLPNIPTDRKMDYEELFEVSVSLLSNANDSKSRKEQWEQAFVAFCIFKYLAALNKEDSNVHIGAAMALRFMGHYFRVKPRIVCWRMERAHLRLANALESYEDYTVLMLLGQWHFYRSRIGTFRRAMMKYWYDAVPPKTSYKQAYKYYLWARTAKKVPFIPNLYDLGTTALFMGCYERAEEHFDEIEVLRSDNEEEAKLKMKAFLINIYVKIILGIWDIFRFMGL